VCRRELTVAPAPQHPRRRSRTRRQPVVNWHGNFAGIRLARSQTARGAGRDSTPRLRAGTYQIRTDRTQGHILRRHCPCLSVASRTATGLLSVAAVWVARAFSLIRVWGIPHCEGGRRTRRKGFRLAQGCAPPNFQASDVVDRRTVETISSANSLRRVEQFGAASSSSKAAMTAEPQSGLNSSSDTIPQWQTAAVTPTAYQPRRHSSRENRFSSNTS